jgi:hypothetical protein
MREGTDNFISPNRHEFKYRFRLLLLIIANKLDQIFKEYIKELPHAQA